jgi:hypothetical protein
VDNGNKKAEPASPAKSTSSPPLRKDLLAMIIDHDNGRRIHRFGEEGVLPALREAFGQRPDWRGFDPHQLSVLLYLYGYLSVPPEDADVEAALPFALQDREGAA